jgi:exonuclease SbcD
MGHLAVSGCDLSGHDPRLVGGMENLSVNKLGDDYDYFALGHNHRPQTLADSHGRVRYSGSPLHVSFDENYPHTVSIVELEKHGATPIVREEHIRQLMHTFTVPKEALPFEEALNELLHFQPDGSGYVRLNIKVKDYAPTNAETRIREALAGKPELKFCYIRTEYERQPSATEKAHFDIGQIKEINPLDIALTAYRERFGQEMDPEKQEMLRTIINETISPVGATAQ